MTKVDGPSIVLYESGSQQPQLSMPENALSYFVVAGQPGPALLIGGGGTAMKKLNVKLVKQRLEELGLSPSSLADKIGTSKQTVSNWLTEKKFPRPARLLKLATILKLTFNEIVIQEVSPSEPIVAFRKKGSHKITSEYIDDAKDKGYLLEHLVDYLPFDNLSTPPVLKNPTLEYNYIHQVANQVRKDIGKKTNEKIEFSDLIDLFIENHAVIIPVFGGHKQNHENALHIFLPTSMTTWVFLNLDSKAHDFKFWMAHELGHVKAPSLRDEDGEDFADKFAGSLLVSKELAESEYRYAQQLSTSHAQLSRIIEVAKDLLISPLTVYLEVNRYAENTNKPKIDLESDKSIYKATNHFCSQYLNVAETVFEGQLPPSPKTYIEKCEKLFKTPIFEALKQYLRDQRKSSSYLQSIMSLAPVDAQALFEEIC